MKNNNNSIETKKSNAIDQFILIKELIEKVRVIANEPIKDKIKRYQKLKFPDLNNILKFNDYNEEWPVLYKKEEKRIANISNNISNIAHIGSTSIFNLESNNIIDIAVLINNRLHLEECIKNIEKIGYQNYGNSPLGKDAVWLWRIEKNTAYVIHFDDVKNFWFDEAIIFRNYLNANPKALLKYKNEKRKLYHLKAENMLMYSLKKLQTIKEIIKEAKSWKESNNC